MPCASTAWIKGNGNAGSYVAEEINFVLCVYAREDDEIRKKKLSLVTKRALQLGNKKIKVMRSVWSTCVLYTLLYRIFVTIA